MAIASLPAAVHAPALASPAAPVRAPVRVPAGAAAQPPQLPAQPPARPPERQTERLRGRVASDSGPVAGAVVTVTRGPDRAVRQDTTDAEGRWAITFEQGTGDYLVAADAPGFGSVRRRIQREGGESQFTANFLLSRRVATLAAVQVRGARAERPPRRTASVTSPEVGANERWDEGIYGALSPAQAGDLAALAGTAPGLTVGPGGPALLEASAASNLTTLNGLALPGGELPRATTRTAVRVSSTTFDATRGGFAGANIDVALGAGDRNFQNRIGYLTLDPAALQATDVAGRQLGVLSQGVRGSFGMDGELVRRTLTYNAAVDVARTTSDLATVFTADAATLARAGLAPDSARALAAAAGRAGLPLAGRGLPAGLPAARTRDNVSFVGRLDLTTDTLRTLALTGIAGRTAQGALGYGPLSAAGAGGERTTRTLGGQLSYFDFVGPGRRVYAQTRLGANRVTTATTPYLDLPGATVLVGSTNAEGAADVTAVALGGRPQFVGGRTVIIAEAGQDVTWMAGGRRHRFKLAAWGRRDALAGDGVPNALGTYGYQSLADLAANRPATFTRTLARPALAGAAWNTAFAAAHQWSPTRTFNVLYGLRAEGNLFDGAAPANPALDAALGVRSGRAPSAWALSPRAGVTWTYSRSRNNGPGQLNNDIGQFYRPTVGTLRGGVGRFRDLLRPDPLALARANTGLVGGTVALSCVGAAVPVPDWGRFEADPTSVPGECAGAAGGPSGLLTERAPSAVLFAPGYQPSGRWSASAGWLTTLGRWLVRADALGSLADHQPSRVDANFAGVARFALPGEAGRPVYVPAGAIDPASGAVSPAASRRSDAFGRVDVLTSDLRARSAQLTVSLAPDLYAQQGRAGRFGTLYGALAYTLQGVRQEFRGFDGGAFGDPRMREWAPGANDARHIVTLQTGVSNRAVGTLTLFTRVQSGLPFTPLVAADVNGDGRVNDRAVVPDVGRDPASAAADPALAASLRSLLASTSAGARACLERSVGAPAARNGCRGPWTVATNAQWVPRLPAAVQRRARVTINVANLAAGLDQLVHGASGLRGWGQPAVPDPVLLVPRGFDAAAPRFAYTVNPRFGATRPAQTLLREPFRVSLDVRLNLSTPFEVQQLRRAVEPVRTARGWEPQSAEAITARYLGRTSSLPRAILAESDSLLLTAPQIATLRRADSAFAAGVLAIYRPLGEELARPEHRVPGREMTARASRAAEAYSRLFWEQVPVAADVLTPIQRQLFPLLGTLLGVRPEDRLSSRWTFGYPVTVPKPASGATPVVPPAPR